MGTFWVLLAGLPAFGAEVWRLDFTDESGGLATGGDLGTEWEWGPVASGPGAGLDGPNAWGTRLSGPHLNDIEEWLELPDLPTEGLASPILGLTHWYDLDESGDGDLARVEGLTDGTWTPLAPVYGYPTTDGFAGESGGWVESWFALEPTATRLRLVLDADATVARDGWYIGSVVVHDGDPVPPRVSVLEAPTDTQALSEGYRVAVVAEDNASPVSGVLDWATSADEGTVALTFEGALGQGLLPVVEPGTRVTWAATVSDGVNLATTPAQSFFVFLAAPAGLRGPTRPVAGDTALLTWSAPASPHPVLEYRVYRESVVVQQTPERRARVPLTDGTQAFAVASLFDTPVGAREGELSEPVLVTAVLPTLSGVWPQEGWPGDRLRLEIEAENFLFAQDDVSVDLGEGVSVIDVDVRSVDRLVAGIELNRDAKPGPRTLSVTSGRRARSVEQAFFVQSAGQRPRLVSAQPGSLSRGQQGPVRLQLSEAPATDQVAVYLGPGVVVEAVGVEGSEVEVLATVPLDSPLGATAIEIDDGERIWTGASFEVRARPPRVGQTCSLSAGAGSSTLWTLGLAGLLLRRRRRANPAGQGEVRGPVA